MERKATHRVTGEEFTAYDKDAAVEAAKHKRSTFSSVNAAVEHYKSKYYRAVWGPSMDDSSSNDWRVYRTREEYEAFFDEDAPKGFW